jgi:putative hemolysin
MRRGVRILLGIVGGLLLACLVGLLVFYVLFVPVRSSGPNQEPEVTVAPDGIGLPNPASAYCEEQGGRLDMRTADDGSEYGLCIFTDGSECEEWTFYRGECEPGTKFMGRSDPRDPILTLAPYAAFPGQEIAVTGTGFVPEISIALRLGAPNAGLSNQNLATIVTDDQGSFEISLTLPTAWPGAQQAIMERELVIAAVDETRNQTLAIAPFINAAAETVECFDDCMIFARDTALVYVAAQYDQAVPAAETWQQVATEESTAPDGSPGQVVYHFAAGDWTLVVSYPVGTAGPVVYRVELGNSLSGFAWEGMVETTGQVTDVTE